MAWKIHLRNIKQIQKNNMTFDYTILEEKMKQLSPEMQKVMTSVEITEAIKAIGDKYSLKLDQESVLFDHTAYVMLGLMPSKDFVKEFAHDAEVDEKTAYSVAEDINKEIFDKMRTTMRQVEESVETADSTAETPVVSPANTNADLEKIGDFTIEEENAPLHQPITETHTEPLVDHLLSKPTYVPQEKVQAAPVAPVTPVAPVKPVEPVKKPSGPDLYREPIE